jgi:hypothetical protein
VALAVAGVLGVLAAAPITAWATRSPGAVPHVRVVNPSARHVQVSTGQVGLGWVENRSELRFDDVIDQGDWWVFHFTYAGVDGGSLVLTRQALEAAGWKVTVPSSFTERMQAAGIAPSDGS